jgi:heme oxygenase (mycobilin-producing)
MAVRILIRRRVPEEKARQIIPLFRQMRQMATSQNGYISGETMRNYNDSEEFMIVSTWQSAADWQNWLKSADRQTIQNQIDDLLGGSTHYDVFHYGFAE